MAFSRKILGNQCIYIWNSRRQIYFSISYAKLFLWTILMRAKNSNLKWTCTTNFLSCNRSRLCNSTSQKKQSRFLNTFFFHIVMIPQQSGTTSFMNLDSLENSVIKSVDLWSDAVIQFFSLISFRFFFCFCFFGCAGNWLAFVECFALISLTSSSISMKSMMIDAFIFNNEEKNNKKISKNESTAKYVNWYQSTIWCCYTRPNTYFYDENNFSIFGNIMLLLTCFLVYMSWNFFLLC